MADVSIDSSVSTSTARGGRALVFTTELIGYAFYIDGDGTFGCSKTTDGGATWGAQVEIAAATGHVCFDVWFDQWTPGDSGTLIHTWAVETAPDDVTWRTLDTNGDTLGTARSVFAGSTAVAGRGVFCSGTKTRSGYLYVAYDIDAGAERGLQRSTDSGTTWSANLATTFVEATLDTCKLYPASNTGDNNDCWAIYYDASALALTLKMWDSSAVAQTESATINAITDGTTDLTGQFGFDASVRHSDGHLILAMLDARDAAGASDHLVFDINGTGSITALTAIQVNTDDHYHPQVFIDQISNDIYVAYNGLRDGSETLGTTTKVYYVKSTNDGGSWSAGNTVYQEGAAGVVVQVWTPLMGPRFYVGWRVGTTLLGNKVNSVTFDITAPILSAQSVGTITITGGIPQVTTDEANGTVYMVIVPDSDSPSVTQIKAGQNSSGGAALANQNQTVTATGVQTFSAVTTLSSGTAYDCWFVHTDAAVNNSSAVRADFTTLPVDSPKSFNNYQFVKGGTGMGFSERIK